MRHYGKDAMASALELFRSGAYTPSQSTFAKCMHSLEERYPFIIDALKLYHPSTWALSQKSSPSFGKSSSPDGRAVYSGMCQCTCGLPAVMEALCEHALSVLSTPVVNASVSLVCLPIHGGAASNVHPPSLHLIQVFSIESLTAARFLTPNVRQMLLTVGPLLSPATSDFWDRVEAETPEGVLLSPVWYTSPVAKNKEVPV